MDESFKDLLEGIRRNFKDLFRRVAQLEMAGGKQIAVPGGGGGDVATDAIWDAAGDIVQGTGANTAARLPIGTANQLLRVNAGATALEYASVGRVLISEQTPTETGTVTFDSIPGGFKSLYLEWFGRSTVNATAEGGSCFLNNDATITNYRRQRITGSGTTASATTGDDAAAFSFVGATGQANSAGHGWLKIIGYSGTTFYKSILGQDWYRSAASTNTMHLIAIEWENTAAVTRIDMVLGSGDYVAGTTFRLYGEY